MKLSENTLLKITNDQAEINYISSRAFDLKRYLKKTQKRTGLDRFEISLIVSKVASINPSETYMDRITSLKRFKNMGELSKSKYEEIIQVMTCIN
jgi:hypothetical protein